MVVFVLGLSDHICRSLFEDVYVKTYFHLLKRDFHSVYVLDAGCVPMNKATEVQTPISFN